MSFSQNHASKEQAVADGRRHDDAIMQRRTIVGDTDGHWLITTIESMWNDDRPIRTDRTMRFGFLADGTEAVLGQLNRYDTAAEIEMPAGSIVRKVGGSDLATWQFRIEDGNEGVDQEWFDVAYRDTGTGDFLLYLVTHHVAGERDR